jgi:amidase
MTVTGASSGVDTDAIWWDATRQAEAVRRGEVSASEIVRAYLARIERLDPTLRAFITVDADGALEAAEAADRRRVEGTARPFEGVAISLKDVLDAKGLPTTHSCEVLLDNVATSDAPLVKRFRDAGFVVLGKSNIPEFCTDMTTSKVHGTARNPWDLNRTPGGSSGGAAAALAAGLCAVSHGTDGAGSVRVPASFCGLVGLKGTRSLITFGPDEGNPYFGSSVDAPLTRTIRDAAAVLDVMAPIGGWTPRRERPFADEVGRDPGQLRIGLCTAFPVGDVDPQCAAAADDVAKLLESLGHNVDVVNPRWELVFMAAALPASGPSNAALVPLDQIDRVEPRNRELIEGGAKLTLLEHWRQVEAVRAASREFLELWDDIDVLVTPTAGWLPPPADWARWDDDRATHMARFATFPNFAQPFNISGQPAFSLPLGSSSEGLPIGVQLVGRKLEEGLLFRLCAQLERARPWDDRAVAAGKALN